MLRLLTQMVLLKKEMAFNLTDENGESLKATPKAKKQTITISDKINSTKQGLLDANTHYNQSLLDDLYGCP